MNNKLLTLTFFLISLIGQSCAQKNMKFDNTEEIEFAKKAMQVIKTGNKEELKSLIHSDVIKRAKDEQIDLLIKQGQDLLAAAEIPNDSLIKQSNKVNYSFRKKVEIAELSFPFSLKSSMGEDSIVYFNIGVSDNKILMINVYEYPFGRRIIEPKHSEPHLEKHSLSYDAITWLRIWYGSGVQENEYENGYGHYAVSGDKEKIDKLNIENELSQLFELLNTTKADSTDFKYLRDKTNGDPEYIYLRFSLNNEPYNRFGESSIYYYLSEEPGKPEVSSGYIILKHSGKTRYLFKKENNPKMVEVLKKITYKKYDRYYEKRWR